MDHTAKTHIDQNMVVVKVSNLTKTFGALTAVDNLSFDVYHGEIFGFLGPNGAGKTTSINMICGLSEPTSGEILFPACPNTGKHKRKNKIHIGICPQENIFWPQLTCREQLVFVGEMYGLRGKTAMSRAMELLEWMGLTEKADVLAGKLSGGMKRRLNICLALVHDPGILILDEPEAGLDPQSRVLVRNFIKSLATKKTIILTTHNMDEADRLADRVAIIDYGKLLLLDTPHNLKKSIGPGDVMEITLDETRQEPLDQLIAELRSICPQVDANGSVLVVKAKNLLEAVPEITARIKEHGFKINEMTMRENTLEDVFIHLTGRKLRQ